MTPLRIIAIGLCVIGWVGMVGFFVTSEIDRRRQRPAQDHLGKTKL